MFGRYPLPLWRRVVGLVLVVVFVWGFYGYMTENHWPRNNGSNTQVAGDDGIIPGDSAMPGVSP